MEQVLTETASNLLKKENDRLVLAIKDFAGFAAIDLMSPREIQIRLRSICGERHHHENTIGSDRCIICKHDIRHNIHLRMDEFLSHKQTEELG